MPYNSYRRNIRGSIALALDPQLIFIQTLIPKLKWIPSSMGRKRMVACTSMEVFAWVTLGGLIAQPICTMLHLLLEKCNYPKISKSFKFLYLFLNIDFLILSNINDPSKIIDIIETKFLKYRYVSVIGSYTVKSCPKVHLFDGKPLGTMILDFHFQVF